MVFDEDTGEALNPLVQMMRSGLGSKYEEVRCLPVTPLPPYSLPYEAALEGEDTCVASLCGRARFLRPRSNPRASFAVALVRRSRACAWCGGN